MSKSFKMYQCISILIKDCSIKCARFNFRKLLRFFEDCKTKDILYKYMGLGEMVQSTLLPKKAHLIKIGLKHGKRGCDCILEVIRQMDPKFLDQLFNRLIQKDRNGNSDSYMFPFMHLLF